MRIAVASSGLGHVARGIESWASDLAAALHRRGEAVTLYQGCGEAPPYGRVLRCLPREHPDNARVAARLPVALGWRLGLTTGYPLEQTTFAASLLAAIRRDPVDIVHVQDPLVALWLDRARRLGLTSARTILGHGTEEPDSFLRKLRWVQHLAPTHLEAARQRGCHRPEWTAIGNFVNTEVFRPGDGSAMRRELGIAPDAIVVLTLAAIKRHHKRVDVLTDIMADVVGRAADRPVHWIIAGGHEADTPELVAAMQARLGPAVTPLVRFPRARIAELCRAADIFLLGSLFEMMPIALLEAAASGLPCVTHDEATLRWMTGAGGIATDLGSRETAVDTVLRLVADDDDRRGRGRLAREHTEANFGEGPITDALISYYRSVVPSR